MRRAQGRGDGADLDPERLGDRAVVEIGEVPQEDRFALPVGERGDPAADPERVVLVAAVPVHALVSVARGRRDRLECGTSRLVDDDPPDPRFEWCVTAKGPAMPDRGDESVLDDIAAAFAVAADRDSHANEVREPRAVERLELRRRRPISPHAGMSLPARDFFIGVRALCTIRVDPCYHHGMARDSATRLNVTLDAEHAAKLSRMAEQSYTAEGTLARSLLSRAIDDAEIDGRTMVEILNGIPGAATRAQRGRDELARGEGIPIDEL
jgi:hypothetical protein